MLHYLMENIPPSLSEENDQHCNLFDLLIVDNRAGIRIIICRAFVDSVVAIDN